MNEADTCRKFVLPKLYEAGWDKSPYSFTEQKTFTDGRIVIRKNGYKRGKQKRADYLLRYRRDFPIAVVEAKADYKNAGDGMQQAKDYAEILGLKFAYATNGKEILEYDYTTGKQMATYLKKFMENHEFDKSIVFCVDQEHADEMRRQIANANSDIVKNYPDYVCRVTADEGDIGKTMLSQFQDIETNTPTILTTSKLLSTGVDAPTVKNVVLARTVGSMCEFKQIIGRGTRLRTDYGKCYRY